MFSDRVPTFFTTRCSRSENTMQVISMPIWTKYKTSVSLKKGNKNEVFFWKRSNMTQDLPCNTYTNTIHQSSSCIDKFLFIFAKFVALQRTNILLSGQKNPIFCPLKHYLSGRKHSTSFCTSFEGKNTIFVRRHGHYIFYF
jgi:hypothetical protein